MYQLLMSISSPGICTAHCVAPYSCELTAVYDGGCGWGRVNDIGREDTCLIISPDKEGQAEGKVCSTVGG